MGLTSDGRLITPRRFGLVHQVSYDFPGTIAQQQALRDAIHPAAGSNFAKLQHRLATVYKAKYDHPDPTQKSSYVTWVFVPLGTLGYTWPQLIQLSGVLAPSHLGETARHEYGHLIDKHLLTWGDRDWFMHRISGPDLGTNDWPHNYQETFANAVKDWIDSDGSVWSELTPILLPLP